MISGIFIKKPVTLLKVGLDKFALLSEYNKSQKDIRILQTFNIWSKEIFIHHFTISY